MGEYHKIIDRNSFIFWGGGSFVSKMEDDSLVVASYTQQLKIKILGTTQSSSHLLKNTFRLMENTIYYLENCATDCKAFTLV